MAAHACPVELSVELRSDPEAAAGMVAGIGIVVVLPDIILWPHQFSACMYIYTQYPERGENKETKWICSVNRVEAVHWIGRILARKQPPMREIRRHPLLEALVEGM